MLSETSLAGASSPPPQYQLTVNFWPKTAHFDLWATNVMPHRGDADTILQFPIALKFEIRITKLKTIQKSKNRSLKTPYLNMPY